MKILNYIHKILFLLCISALSADAQANVQGSGFVDFADGISRLNYGFAEIKKDIDEVKGSSLLFDDYLEGTFKLKQGNRSPEYLLNYDLLSNNINVSGNKVIYTVPVSYLDSMTVKVRFHNDRVFSLVLDENAEEKLMEVLVDGTHVLLKDVEAKLISPTYRASIDAGDRFYRIRKKVSYYLLHNQTLTKLPNKFKKLKNDKILGSYYRKLKKSKYDFKKEADIVHFFQMVNKSN